MRSVLQHNSHITKRIDNSSLIMYYYVTALIRLYADM